MLQLSTTLTWAVPVPVTKLGAHLEAYIETLPVVNTLRMCNRFGTGPNCTTNKLPTEMIKTIEGHVVAMKREERLDVWEKAIRCFEQKCNDLDDHLAREDLYHFYHYELGCRSCDPCDSFGVVTCVAGHESSHDSGEGCPAGKYDPQKDEEVKDALRKARLTYTGDGDLIHEENVDKWCSRIGHPAERYGFFKYYQNLTRSHFGIDVWATHTRRSAMPNPDGNLCNPICWRTTLAYLTLPGNYLQNEERAQYQNREERLTHITIGTQVQVDANPSSKSLQRFPRAMGILGLDASSPSLNAATATSAAQAHSSQPPQLTLLAHSASENDTS